MAPTLPDIYEGARREIFSLFGITTFSIMLLTPDKQHIHWVYGHEYGQPLGYPPSNRCLFPKRI
ncbi:MAG: hypothetical protein M5U34_00845 [Chloroflexi bacterium]|nr:hypothetical protein [Chloroflexota bacterium]